MKMGIWTNEGRTWIWIEWREESSFPIDSSMEKSSAIIQLNSVQVVLNRWCQSMWSYQQFSESFAVTTKREFSMVIYTVMLMCLVLVEYIYYSAAASNSSTDKLLWAYRKHCCCTYCITYMKLLLFITYTKSPCSRSKQVELRKEDCFRSMLQLNLILNQDTKGRNSFGLSYVVSD